MTYKKLLMIAVLLMSNSAIAGHHEKAGTLMPAAMAGQVVVAYEVPCANPAAGADSLKALIAYEASASPVAYSSVATTIGDAKVGAVDVHRSTGAMEQAFSWQEQDETWLSMQADALALCGADLESIGMSVHVVQ